MRHERHGTGTNIENYISIGLLKVKDIKKREGIFFSLRVISYRFNKSWPNIKIFHARERPWFLENFYLQIKNPPTSENTTVDNLSRSLSYGKKVEVKRRPQSFAPARFSLTITLNSTENIYKNNNNQ